MQKKHYFKRSSHYKHVSKPAIEVPEYFREWRNRFLIQNAIHDNLGLSRGIFLGDSSSVKTEVKDQFREAGLSHLLAASGFNCWIVAFVFTMLGQITLALFSHRLHSRVSLRARKLVTPVSQLLGAWLFWLWTDQSPPITRSVLMISSKCLLECFELEVPFWRLLLVQYLVSLGCLPRLWHSASFQLTFGCLFGIVFIPKLFERFKPEMNHFSNGIWNYTAAGFGACLGTIPTTWIIFGEINFNSITTNWFAVPPVSFIVMPVALFQMMILAPGLPLDHFRWFEILNTICSMITSKTCDLIFEALQFWMQMLPSLRYSD